jgi:hypothetical protein
MSKKVDVTWLPEPDDKNYPAAESHLGLLYDDKSVKVMVGKLRAAPVSLFKTKDISGLSLLGVNNSHVERDHEKIEEGKSLSPILLVRDPHNSNVIIADGYHRLCAVYSFNEDELIPCKIV